MTPQQYRRPRPDPADRSSVVRSCVLAVAETLARLDRDLPVRLVAAGREADLAALPTGWRERPAAALVAPEVVGSGPTAPGGLTLRVEEGRGATGASCGQPYPGGPDAAAVRVRCEVAEDIRVTVDCTSGDGWRHASLAVAEMVAELLAALLADPRTRPVDAAAIGAASRRRVLAVPAVDHGPFRPLAGLVEEQVDRDPHRTAVVHAGAALTYGRLDRMANALAVRLRAAGVGRGDLVPLSLGNSLELPVGILAVLKLGAAFVPLDPHWPADRLRTALDVLRPRVTLTAGAPVPGGRQLPVRVDALAGTDRRPTVESGPDDVAYGVFTSGTTGVPRCALNTQRGLGNRLQFMTRWFGPPPGGAEVVLQNTRPAFDSAVWQLLWPLATGGRTVVPVPGDFLDLQQTVDTIEQYGVTVTDFVPTALNLLVAELERDPEALRRVSGLRHLVVGGEEIGPRQVHRLQGLLPGLRVSNAYGPSETAIGMVFHPVEPADGDDVPLGRPIDNCAAVVVDGLLRPLPPGAVGEIAIGGACVGAGYAGAVAVTAQRFPPNPFPEVPGDRLYRSGDLGWYDRAGRLHFAGRRDFQAKVGGVRIELGEVALAAESHPGVRRATALVVGGELTVVGATGDPGTPDSRQRGSGADGPVTEGGLREHLRRLLPRTSMPRLVVVLPTLPLADSGKVDRATLVDLLETRLGRAAATVAGGSDPDRVLSAFRVALADPGLPADADFLASGGDSLRAVALVAALRTGCGVDVGVQDLLRHSTAAAMGDFVRRQHASGPRPGERAVMEADAVAPLPATRAAAGSGPPRRLLLTGATGFVGGQLAHELLAGTDAEVRCLVRAPDDRTALDRVVVALRGRGLWRAEWAGRLVGVAGALDRPGLGLRPDRWRELADGTDSVLHAGALVNFLYDYGTHRAANVLGTVELLRLAQHGRSAALHHVSTLGVLDREAALRGTPLPEQVDPERVRPPVTGYSRSKWVAERVLARAREAGATITVLRLGEVLPAPGGSANPRALTHLLLTAFARLRACPERTLPSDYTPVDWAARVAVAALTDPAARGRDLHVLHPRSVSLTEILPMAGVPLERVPDAEFRRRVAARPDLALLAGILRRVPDGLDQLVVDNPRLFRADSGAAVAERAGLDPPDLTRAVAAYAGHLTGLTEEAVCGSA